MRIMHIFIIMLILTLSTSCSNETVQTKNIGDLQLAMSTEPDPLEVGETALIKLNIGKTGKSVNQCHIRFRQHMPGMEMKNDHTYIEMQAQDDSGKYQGRGLQYHMGGDWEIEFEVKCGEAVLQKIGFPYHIKWPE